MQAFAGKNNIFGCVGKHATVSSILDEPKPLVTCGLSFWHRRQSKKDRRQT